MTGRAEAGESGKVILYEAPDGQVRLDVRLERDTVWLTQAQMAELFGRERSVITKHVNNVFADGELLKRSNVQDLHIATSDKPVAAYSLDVIISVGYRVKSKRGVQFRQWATRVLRDHLVQGYTFNQTRLAERGLVEARQTLDLLARSLQNQALVDDTGRAVLELITGYADTWRLLLEYDEDRLATPPGARPSKGVLNFARASAAIADFKRELMARNEATPLFGEALYRSREERAANLLYLVIKDHPFSDGNKRIGSFLFMLYLKQEDIMHALNPSALTALALLIAESAPASKGLMVRLIMNLLVERQA